MPASQGRESRSWNLKKEDGRKESDYLAAFWLRSAWPQCAVIILPKDTICIFISLRLVFQQSFSFFLLPPVFSAAKSRDWLPRCLSIHLSHLSGPPRSIYLEQIAAASSNESGSE